MSEKKSSAGSMDIAVHEKTFEGFVRFVAKTIVACILVLILLAIVNG
ncbi:aa3-type cytochrome c oxidase subunit IV [Tropicimonas sp. IMCC6043]|nr:aa3-type cytochrome c oxidase subunit IV [Tropicimonas sp. IMCC6043]RYH10569.1 aa3-type cytochrome c oxidase subunit IV [Tropicimonas sp. IMCC6043]